MTRTKSEPPIVMSSDRQVESSWWSRQSKWIKFGLIPLTSGFAGMALLMVTLRVSPLPTIDLSSPTEIEAMDGEHIADWTLSGARGHMLPLHQLPKSLQEATLAVEDAKFYHHHAFDFPAMVRAFVVNLHHGKVVEGGSTITQQLAKNLYLNQDRTIWRKVREALYAMQLEMHESKDTILSQYLNVIYYGNGAYGVDAAAQAYFHKSASHLDLAESSMLAGLPKGPALYSPVTHFEAAKARQHVVLNRMVHEGYISPIEAQAAYREPLFIRDNHVSSERAPYFTETVMQEATERFHLTSDDLYKGNVHIVSTLDPELQREAERAIRSTIPKNSKLQVAVVSLDPKTGAIRALVGGRSFTQSPYNRVFAERQPGSTFKAVLYTSALESGWTPAKEVFSAPKVFRYGPDQSQLYPVHDYGEFYANRPLTLREAIARSDNVYAVTTNMAIGPLRVMGTAHDMGLRAPLKPYPSLALGVFPESPLDMATAYAALANGGKRVTPYTIEEIRSEALPGVATTTPNVVQVVAPSVAFQVTDLLKSVLRPGGTGAGVAGYLHGTAAAKTGTTDTDAWMVGYTPKLVTAVWVGYDTNQPLTVAEAHLASPIWAKYMGMAQAHLGNADFSPAKGLVKLDIDPTTGERATAKCPIRETDYFVSGTEPKLDCQEHPVDTSLPAEVKRGILGWLGHLFGR